MSQATVGAKNLHYAIATVAEDGTVTYDSPVKIADFQKITISASTSTDKYYADDRAVDIINSFEGCTVTLTTQGMSTETEAVLKGITIDENGVLTDNIHNEPPYIALGFQSLKANGKYRFVWLLLGKMQIFNEEYETIKDKKEPKSLEIPFEFVARADGNWRHKIDEDSENAPEDLETKWFQKVYDGSFTA